MLPESRLQSRCRMFLDSHLQQPCWWSSIGHEKKQTLIQGQMQKARGIRRGLPDVMVWAPSYFLGVELKVGANQQTEAQQVFQATMAALGHGYAVVRSVEQLGEALHGRGIPLAPNWRLAAQIHDAALDAEPKPIRRAAKPRGNKRQVTRVNTLMLALARGPHEP